MKKAISWMVCMLGLLVPGPVMGQANDSQETAAPVATLEQVVVTATRQEEKIASVPANVTVVTEAEIEQSPARDVPELLRTELGVHVSDISGNRRSYTVDLRGFGETAGLNTLVLVDGRRINQPDLGGTDWTLIPLDRIERIEIIRGGRGSVLYGDNAAGGVINIITKKGRGFEAEAEAAAGSYDTFQADAELSGAKYDLSYAVNGSYRTSDGYRDNSDTRAKDLGLNLDYYATDNLKLGFSSGYHEDKTGLPGALKESDFQAGASRTDSVTPHDFADIEDYYFKAEPELYFLENSVFKIGLSYRNRQSLFFSSFTGGTYEGDTEIQTVSASPQVILRRPVYGLDNRLTLGVDMSEDEEDITNTTYFSGFEGTDVFELKRKNYGVYIHDELDVTEKLSVSGGYRYDRSKFEFAPSTPEQTTASEDLYTAGATYDFRKGSQVYFSFSRSFRNPLLDEFFNFYTNTVNTQLKPQTSDNYELGVRHRFSDRFYGLVNIFRIDTEDEILYDPLLGMFGANGNLDGETRRDGVEVSLTGDFSRVRVTGRYTYTDATIRDGKYDGNDFPGVPEHQAALTTVFSATERLSVSFNGIYVGERPFISDFENAFEDQDDYFVANAKIRYRWKKASAYLNVNNLFDKEYSEYGALSLFSTPAEKAYYPSPKINFLLGFTVEM